MKLYYFKGEKPNFGDELNATVWKSVLPKEFFDETEPTFLGIGTLLNDRRQDKEYWVLGAGAGYGRPPGPGKKLRIFAVRGPETAKKLEIDQDLAITDPALLIRKLRPNLVDRNDKIHRFSYIPHFMNHISNERNLRWACKVAKLEYIDPCAPVEQVLEKISRTNTILAEAMHGAIVADALGTQWIPITTSKSINQFKWRDWCCSINVDYKPVRIWKIGSVLKFDNPLRAIIALSFAMQLVVVRATTRPYLSSRSLVVDLERRLLVAIDEMISVWKQTIHKRE